VPLLGFRRLEVLFAGRSADYWLLCGERQRPVSVPRRASYRADRPRVVLLRFILPCRPCPFRVPSLLPLSRTFRCETTYQGFRSSSRSDWEPSTMLAWDANPRFVPSSGFPNLSTVCSVSQLHGHLFSPQPRPGFLAVQGFLPPRSRTPSSRARCPLAVGLRLALHHFDGVHQMQPSASRPCSTRRCVRLGSVVSLARTSLPSSVSSSSRSKAGLGAGSPPPSALGLRTAHLRVLLARALGVPSASIPSACSALPSPLRAHLLEVLGLLHRQSGDVR
jgi:hypothetical protein